VNDHIKRLRDLYGRLQGDDAKAIVWALEHIESLERHAAKSALLAEQMQKSVALLPQSATGKVWP
jgi:hypothetical protein